MFGIEYSNLIEVLNNFKKKVIFWKKFYYKENMTLFVNKREDVSKKNLQKLVKNWMLKEGPWNYAPLAYSPVGKTCGSTLVYPYSKPYASTLNNLLQLVKHRNCFFRLPDLLLDRWLLYH